MAIWHVAPLRGDEICQKWDEICFNVKKWDEICVGRNLSKFPRGTKSVWDEICHSNLNVYEYSKPLSCWKNRQKVHENFFQSKLHLSVRRRPLDNEFFFVDAFLFLSHQMYQKFEKNCRKTLKICIFKIFLNFGINFSIKPLGQPNSCLL